MVFSLSTVLLRHIERAIVGYHRDRFMRTQAILSLLAHRADTPIRGHSIHIVARNYTIL